MPTDPAPPKRRPRLSLLSLLLLTTVVALALGLVLSERRSGRLLGRIAVLESEVRAYRTRLGVLHVNDPTKIHAIKEVSPSHDAHRYRVHLPEGREYVVRYRARGLSADSSFSTEGFYKIYAQSGLIELDYDYPTNRSTGTVRPVAKLGFPHFDEHAVGSSGGVLVRTLSFQEDWLLANGKQERRVDTGGADFVTGVAKKQETRNADESLLLHRRQRLNDRAMEHGGLEVWIEPAPVAEPVPPPPGA